MPTPTYDLIASNVLSSSASSVTFSSIPATYRDLILVADVLTTSSGERIRIQVNADAGNNYSTVGMEGNGSTTWSGTSTQTYYNIDANNATLTSTENSVVVVQFMDYSATDKHKTILVRVNRAGAVTKAVAGRWASTSAINEITFYASANLNTGTVVSLYGIAG